MRCARFRHPRVPWRPSRFLLAWRRVDPRNRGASIPQPRASQTPPPAGWIWEARGPPNGDRRAGSTGVKLLCPHPGFQVQDRRFDACLPQGAKPAPQSRTAMPIVRPPLNAIALRQRHAAARRFVNPRAGLSLTLSCRPCSGRCAAPSSPEARTGERAAAARRSCRHQPRPAVLHFSCT